MGSVLLCPFLLMCEMLAMVADMDIQYPPTDCCLQLFVQPNATCSISSLKVLAGSLTRLRIKDGTTLLTGLNRFPGCRVRTATDKSQPLGL